MAIVLAYTSWAMAMLLFFATYVSSGSVAGRTCANPKARNFSVKDSIEMARFPRNLSGPVFSPDGKDFAVVTTRGLMQSNELESTLWIFNMIVVRKFLRTGKPRSQCRPMIAAKLAAVPQLPYPSSYESLITKFRWSADSRSVYFLGQDKEGRRILYRKDLLSRSLHKLTPKDRDVTDFAFAGDQIIYETAVTQKSANTGIRLTSVASDVTGLPLTSILFPKKSGSTTTELWIERKGRSRRLMDPDTARPFQPADLPAAFNVLSTSPSGRFVAVLLRSKTIPPAWKSYVPGIPYLRLRSSSAEEVADFWPAQYAVIELKSGRIRFLIDAPNGWSLGSSGANRAVWARDERVLLLTNTYLDLDSSIDQEKLANLRPCVAASVDLNSMKVTCISRSLHKPVERRLVDVSFGQNDREVFLNYATASGSSEKQLFRFANGSWHPGPTGPNRERRPGRKRRTASGNVEVVIEQDLNLPPALWVKDLTTGKQRKIWDPNPQFASIRFGEVSVLRWRDGQGYEWTAGLVKPPAYVAGQTYPLVIQTHGFQPHEFMTDGAFTTAFAAQPLASAGIMVLQMPIRHDHMVSPSEAQEQVAGFLSAIEVLRSAGLVDPNRVGIIGFSRTCYYVESALIEDPHRFAAATLADGVDESYLQYLLFADGEAHREADSIYGGPPFGLSLWNWIDRAPGFHVSHITTPLRIEAISPASIIEEWEIYSSLFLEGRPVDLVYLKDGQHILQKPLERLASQQGNVDWFRFWLKNEEDSDPSKREQYQHWQELRDRRKREGRLRFEPTLAVESGD
jgi:dipeptidyl aminopeptidase/acylaminoacyl peptidase